MSSLPPPAPTATPEPDAADARDGTAADAIDLDRVAQDLHDVEIALDRLDRGTYWTCEVTGEPLPEDLLAADPVARRLPPAPGAAAPAPATLRSGSATW